MTEKYYVGLDIGTDSVGWAVTNKQYEILKFNGKLMLGSRLFDSANTAAEQRIFRSNARRLNRKKWRIQLLQELFAPEISKIDFGFYQRLKDSFLKETDKAVFQKNMLFNDKNYTDKDYYREFPTIYHLRKALIENKKEYDIRLVYIALHHLIKHRGHFLFQGSMAQATSFEEVFKTFKEVVLRELEVNINCNNEEELKEVLKNKRIFKKEKINKIMSLFDCDKTNKKLKAIISLICGSKVVLNDIFGEMVQSEEQVKISFAEKPYDELRPEIENVLYEQCNTVDVFKAMYDWAILADILSEGNFNGRNYLSFAKVKIYEKHKNDLNILKCVLNTYSKNLYSKFFRSANEPDNYSAYVGSTKFGKEKFSVKRCAQDLFYKKVLNILKEIEAKNGCTENIKYIKQEIEAQTFLPLQVTKENGVIPYQVNEAEAKVILNNASEYLDFLNDKDDNGLIVKDKILKILTFRIPYYVGPLNQHSPKSWMERKSNGVITPWNFEDKIDVKTSAEKFILRMTNKCTYLIGKDVLPKNSLLYSEFMVWNELNNVKVKGQKLNVELKNKFFEFYFRKQKSVTKNKLIEFLKTENIRDITKEDISGIDQGVFKASLASYLCFKSIFGRKIENYSVQKIAEDCISWITLYPDDRKMLKEIIRSNYGEQDINNEELEKIIRLKFTGWGRLSKEFLTEIKDDITQYNVLNALKNTNDNLMQLLSVKYTFSDNIDRFNAIYKEDINKFDYESLISNLILSPSVKRPVWQALLILKEIVKIKKDQPAKVFIEVARGKESLPERKDSRKDKLLKVYDEFLKDKQNAAIIDEYYKDIAESLKLQDNTALRAQKLFLYYTQLGKCMYSGENIDLASLNDVHKYDKDHIYPQSKTKDDSLVNLVLVKRELNAEKSNDIISTDVRKKMLPFWKLLHKNNLISTEKFNRLTRSTPLTNEELAGFINRQLVETRQATKIVSNLLKDVFPKAEIVTVNAKAVSDFRKSKLQAVKVRSINDLHHAQDAYLNIVVGNVYYEKFTNNPLKWLNNENRNNYSLNRMFDYDIKKREEFIWLSSEEGSIKTVKNMYNKKNILYTRYATSNKGAFFDQQIKGARENPTIPVKKGLSLEYGGFKSVNPAYFALVESEGKKGKKQRSIEAVPLYLAKQFEKSPQDYVGYCAEKYGLKNPVIILPKIKKDSLFLVDGYPMHLRGSNGIQLSMQNAVQLNLEADMQKYCKRIEKYIINNLARKDKRVLLPIRVSEGITKAENLYLYDVLLEKQQNTLFSKRPASQIKLLQKSREKFNECTLEEQCIVLNEILHLMQCKPLTADLSLIGGSKRAGNFQINKIISNFKRVFLINQSVTGLFEQKIDLLTVQK